MKVRKKELRAWHKSLGVMMPVYAVVWRSKKQKPHIVTNRGWLALNDNVVLLENIGKVDMHGAPIFEGDIIAYEHDPGDGVRILKEVVEWNGFSYMEQADMGGVADFWIIGNVFENPIDDE